MPSLGQIIFFIKNKADFTDPLVTFTASEGNLYASKIADRSNLDAWMTTGSVDANNTTLTVDLIDTKIITDLLLIKHNFKSYTVKWWDGSAYQDFTPAINETTNLVETNYYEVAAVSTHKLQITVRGTQVPDSDKFLYQFIATEKLGRLAGWPIVKKPTLSRKRQKNIMLSGKSSLFENIGNFAVTLEFKNFTSDADLTLIESLYDSAEGFLIWLCGGNETQFKTVREGYRLEDLYLMKCSNEYAPEYVGGIYKNPLSISVNLDEVIE